MSTFEVKVVKIDNIEPIEGADAIELARIADYRSVVRKGDYKAGDLAVYIPEASIVPEWLLKDMGLEGKLAGSHKNRVKAIKLRGSLSQGLLLKCEPSKLWDKPYPEENCVLIPSEPHEGNQGGFIAKLGDNVSENLGIKKYEPEIPTCMAGEVCNIGTENVLKYDIENLKKYPNIFTEGEEVSVTEKLHGTFCQIGFLPNGISQRVDNSNELFENDFEMGGVFVCSKGLGSQGLVFKNNEKNLGNLYVKTFKELTKDMSWNDRLSAVFDMDTPIYIMGEVFGKGVQDLTYGLEKPEFRVFDIYIGKPGQGRFLNPAKMRDIAKELGLQMVTELYVGPYDRAKIDNLANGKTITGNGINVLEGVVIKPVEERRDDTIGRVFLKHINEEYLLRKGNATEFN